MSRVSRRKALAWIAAAGAACARTARSAAGQVPASPPRDAPAEDRAPASKESPHDFNLPRVGALRAPRSAAIERSAISVGFETLDRRHFDPARTYRLLGESGAKWARCQTGWNRCETVAGEYSFEWLDEVVDHLLEIGIQPWFNLGYGNKLYTPEATDAAAVGWAPVFTAAAREAWVRFVRAIAARFADRVKHWEIWNEPNISHFWKPRSPSARDYVELVRLSASEIRRLVPGAVIIGGALAGMPKGYLAECIASDIAESIDKLSFHPYRPVPEQGYAAEVAGFRRMLGDAKAGLELWQGENGCPSKGGPGTAGALSQLPWDERQQAKWLVRRIVTDLRLRLELTSYFHTVDLVGYRGRTNYKGLLRGDYTPKQAYTAFQCVASLLDGRSQRAAELDGAITLEPSGDDRPAIEVAAFRREGQPLWAYWCPSKLPTAWTAARVGVSIAPFPPPGPELPGAGEESPRASPTSDQPSAARIDRPVLIDSLTGVVYRLGARAQGNRLRFDSLPLLDYPLWITTEAAVVLG